MSKIKKIYENMRVIIADERKSFARTPRKFALKDWKNALREAGKALKVKRIGILGAGVAYFATLAVFPAIAAAVAILSFAVSEENLHTVFESIETYLPSDIGRLISTQLDAALQNPSSGIFIIIVGILISLFSLSGAVSNIISAVNAIYETSETRKFVKLRLTSLTFIGIGGILAILVTGLLVLNDSFLVSIGVPQLVATMIIIVRWIVIAALVAVSLSVFYRYAPDRGNPHWQWVTWGSCIATAIWLVGTTLFFIYARYFAHFTDSYSIFAGIIVLMTWLNLTAFAILIGAEINFRLENQTRARTTA